MIYFHIIRNTEIPLILFKKTLAGIYTLREIKKKYKTLSNWKTTSFGTCTSVSYICSGRINTEYFVLIWFLSVNILSNRTFVPWKHLIQFCWVVCWFLPTEKEEAIVFVPLPRTIRVAFDLQLQNSMSKPCGYLDRPTRPLSVTDLQRRNNNDCNSVNSKSKSEASEIIVNWSLSRIEQQRSIEFYNCILPDPLNYVCHSQILEHIPPPPEI